MARNAPVPRFFAWVVGRKPDAPRETQPAE
jgi:hypothetical protein